MTTHIEAEAVVRRMEKYGEPFAAPIVACWREHMQPAVPTPPDDLELVEEDGVPVFRAPADDDYGWLDTYGAVRFTPGGNPSPEFNGRRYIVRQVTPPVPSEVERWPRLTGPGGAMPPPPARRRATWRRPRTCTTSACAAPSRRHE